MAISVIQALSSRHVVQLQRMYEQEWWTRGRTRVETQRMLKHSDCVIGLVDGDGRLCAFCRVLTDQVFKALLFDVIVDASFRGQGLGQRLLEEVRAHPKVAGVKHLELYCLPEMVPFYARFGFSADVGGVRFLRSVQA
jgi:GNAT superfamily N-acetyltransferase